MSHARAACGMVLVTLMWSTAGVVSRSLQTAESFEVTFFRSLFNFVGLGVALTWMRGWSLWADLLRSPRVVWMSGVCWSVMFTAFMVALTMTRVANVLVTMSISPLLTAVFARVFLHHRQPARTWVAIAVAGAGIAWMFGRSMQAADARSLAGMAVALRGAAVVGAELHGAAARRPRAARRRRQHPDAGAQPDLFSAVLIGAALSALVTLPLAWPFKSNAHDLGLLFGLGVVPARDPVPAAGARGARAARARGRAAGPAGGDLRRAVGLDRRRRGARQRRAGGRRASSSARWSSTNC